MTYNEWFEAQGRLHAKVIEKLKDKTTDEIIDYFKFENMVENEPDFCPLYKEKKKCHDLEDLNCYLCACPNFRFSDDGFEKVDGKTLFSSCSINSKDGGQFIGEDYIHQDCSGCMIPHKKKYIKKNFSTNWFEIMKDVKRED